MAKIIFLLLCVSIIHTCHAQNRMVSGWVRDDKGEPIAGASISTKNLKSGSLTGSNGSFTISIPENTDTLIVSSVNYITRIVRITDSIHVMLIPTEGSLSEVQIVGYGTLEKTNQTGSASTVKGIYLENKPFSSVDKMLQGAVAGVQSSSTSGAPGSRTGVIIRGFGTIESPPRPLWVIDGAIATTGDLSIQTSSSNPLSSLNPDDIESITVLKDAATTSIYGSRAANGVIIVTTKKGRSGKTVFNFSGEAGGISLAYKPDNKPLSSLEYQTILRAGVINAGFATDNASADIYISDPNGLNIPADYTKTNTNWLNEVTQTGYQSQYNVSLSGGNVKTQFYISAGVFSQDGTTIATNFKRYNGSLSLSNKVNDKFMITAALSGSAVNQNTPPTGFSRANPVFAQSFLLPWYSPYNSDGSLRYLDPQNEFPYNTIYNPVVIAQWNKMNYQQNVVRGNVSGEYKILDNLIFTSLYSAEYFDINENNYLNPIYGTGYFLQGSVLGNYQRIFNWTWTNTADYKHFIRQDIYFNLKLGYEAYNQNIYNLGTAAHGFPDNLSLQYLASSALPVYSYSVLNSNSTNSFFSVADFNYKDRYIVSGSFRRDGSSRFGADNKWGNFYSVGGAWNISKEAFFDMFNNQDLLKLRVSYGLTGNQDIGDYTSLATFGYGFDYSGSNGSALTNVGNPDLTWEKAAIFNIGLDFVFLKNRLSGTIEYYNKNTTDLIEAVPLSLTAGVISTGSGNNTQNRNAGAVNNRGVEITLNGKPLVTNNFLWNINFTFAYNRNIVTNLYLGTPIPENIPVGSTLVTVGHNISEYYTPLWAGVNSDNGRPLWYTDATKKEKTSDYNAVQPAYSGMVAYPKYFGSFTNTFTYKNFSLQVQLYYSGGNYLLDPGGNDLISDGGDIPVFNQLTQQLSAWQKPGDKTNVPQVILYGNHLSNSSSTRYLYDGDYIRMRNVSLSYNLTGKILKQVQIDNISVYIRGTNLLTIVKDENLSFDPEVGVAQANFNVYQPKTISGGIKISF
jgi:TonB-linked SusC/RagA family outer membrane protein